MTETNKPAPTPKDFDREFRAQVAQMTAGLAPTAFTTAWADWAMHLALSPARQQALQQEALQRAQDTWTFALRALAGAPVSPSEGLAAAGHPILDAVLDGAEDGLVYTGRLALRTHPWLADHAVGDTVLLPGTALLDLVLHAGVRAAQLGDLALCFKPPVELAAAGQKLLQIGNRAVRIAMKALEQATLQVWIWRIRVQLNRTR